MMRIAVPSNDRSTIAQHFGRAGGFLVYDVEDEVVEAGGYRSLADSQPLCACGPAERSTRHQRILDALEGCHTVIARGMGAHLYDDLNACGKSIVLTDVEDARQAVDLFAAHALPERGELGCGQA